MVEAKTVVAGEQGAVGADELFPREREQDRSETGRVIRWDEAGDGAAMEQSAFDGSPLEDRALAGLQAVDAGREERSEGRGDCLFTCVRIVGQHREHLLHEERIALGRNEHPFAQPGRQVVLAQQFVDEALRQRRRRVLRA